MAEVVALPTAEAPPGGASGPRRRPRGPVQPADRAPRARGPGLLRARRTPAHRGTGRGAKSCGADPLRRSCVGVRGRRARHGHRHLLARNPDARHLLRHAAHGARPRRRRRAHGCLGVRQGRARGGRVGALPRPAARADRVDEPSRLGDGSAGRRGGHGELAVDADRGLRGSRATSLRRPVPPRGRAHAARAGDPEELPLRGRRHAADLDPGGRHRGAGRTDPGSRRLGARALRTLRRRRLGRRGTPRAQGGRRPAHVRLRRPRPASRERGRAGRRDVRRSLPGAARPRPGAEAFPHAARRRLRSRRRSARSSARSSSASSRRRRESSETSGSSCRGRSTPTSSSPAAGRTASPR